MIVYLDDILILSASWELHKTLKKVLSTLRKHRLYAKAENVTLKKCPFNSWTSELIQRSYWWPNLRQDCKDYVGSCKTCTRNKGGCTQAWDLLRSLPVPDHRWKMLSMDFIVDLPLSERFSTILVVIACQRWPTFWPGWPLCHGYSTSLCQGGCKIARPAKKHCL